MMMNLLRRWAGRCGPMFLVIPVAGALLSAPNVAQGDPTELFFASVAQPVGVAAAPGELLVTRSCGEVDSIGPTGVVAVFATLPASEVCSEAYIAIAPAAANPADFLNTPVVLTPNGFFSTNEAGFASNFVYVTQGPTVLKIAPDGSSVSPFHAFSSPDCGPSRTGITFDKVGTFGHHLIIVCSNGNVWLLDKNGNTVAVDGTPSESPIAFIDATGPYEGPDVAPSTFSPFGGQLLVAAENAFAGEGTPTGRVFAVTPGTFSTVASVRAAEAVGFIPSPLCNFGSSGGTYFTAVPGGGTPGIYKLPRDAFAGLAGDALVPSESGVIGESPSPGLTLLTPGTESVTSSTFSAFFAPHQGAAFCVDSVPTDLTGKIQREPDPINPNAHGVITALFLPIPGIFDPFTMIADVDHMRAGITGTEKSFAFCTPEPVQTPEGPARDCKFFKDMLGIPPGGGVYSGSLYFKAQYAGPEGGSDAGGGG